MAVEAAVPNPHSTCYNPIDKRTIVAGSQLRPAAAQDDGGVEMMRPTSPDPPARPPSFGRDGQANPPSKADWRMRYEMGPIELAGWMIVGGLLIVFVCALLAIAFGPPLNLGI
jgi:hypothetical protein